MSWLFHDQSIRSRLWLGTAQYPSPAILREAIQASQTNLLTVSLRRQNPENKGGSAFWDILKASNCRLLPNTAGCLTAKQAITTAQMAREIFNTNWIKLEVIADDYTLHPDPFGLVEAAQELVSQGFEVFPFCTEDLAICERLVNVGCQVLMPWAAPIGTGKGFLNLEGLQQLRVRFSHIPLIVDAGLRSPSQAAKVLELGFDAVLVNSAIALAVEPVKMAAAFSKAVEAGYEAYQAGLMPKREVAHPSTPLLGRPFNR